METAVKSEKHNLFSSVIWMTFANIAARVLYFLTSIITARLLTADDFGIIGMAATFTNFILTAGNMGITQYLIYKQGITDEEIRSVYFIQTVLAFILAGILIAGSPIIAHVYKTPEVANVTVIAAFAILVAWVGWYPKSYLFKQMKQNVVAKIETLGNFINFSLIIILAFLGFKYLSYVIPLLISQAISSYLFIAYTKLKPSLKINMSLFKDVFNYGKSYMPQQFLVYFTNQLDYIFAGCFLGTTLLGYYYFGFEKAVLIVLMLRAITSSSFAPVFSELQSDNQKLKDKFVSLNNKLAFVFFPVIFLMIVNAKELIHFVFGSKWDASILTFQLILAYCFLKIFFEMAIILFNSTGKPDQNLKHYLITLPVYIIGFYFGIKYAGIVGLSIMAFLVHSFSSLIMTFRIKKVFGWSFSALYKTNIKIIIALLLQLTFLWPLKMFLEGLGLSNFLILTIICSLSLLVYLITAKQFFNYLYNDVVLLIIQKISGKISIIFTKRDLKDENA